MEDEFELQNEDEKPAPKAAEPSDIEKRVAALEADIKAKDNKIKELAESERYWASKAKPAQVQPAEPEDEGDDQPDEKPEQLLDDLSTKGIDAIRKRGFVTAKDVERMVNSKAAQIVSRSTFDQRLGKDFPDLQDPKSELFQRASKHYNEMAELDPSAKTSPFALYSAAKLAKFELDTEAKAVKDKEEKRRDKIEGQSPQRSRGAEESDGDDMELSPQSRAIIKNFARFGVTEESYRKNALVGASGRRNGR